ncbi:glycoside hydrolase superfamily [Pseudomassariella vexata]|uniref:glucan 1,3-beta-glucosidase n=1 Tax=Pseudomassariella vexata TaxID=1141098 RepID=A0A1Y2DTH6_9PEZI|nr:glycoside hydrolase superfamily [Pseudomassariella vexata]ORY62557.1 glycoside hydrolase superfamily [Pseudomassariella vexata]
MAPRDASASRHRESERRQGHRKKSSRERSSRRAAESAPDATRSGTGSGNSQQLSLDALAQLNDYNTSRPVTESDQDRPRDAGKRRKKARPSRAEYKPVNHDYEPPAATPTRERRKRDGSRDVSREARRERRRRPTATDYERGHESPGGDRRRRPAYTDDERDYDSPRRERRNRETHAGVETDRETPRSRRRRKEAVTDGETDYESPRKEKRHRRAAATDDEEVRRDKTRGQDKTKSTLDPATSTFGLKRRVVSGAAMEEGRAAAIRGGAGSSKHSSHESYDSIARAKDGYYEEQPFVNKKKRKWMIIGAVAAVLLIIIIAVAAVVSKKNSSSSSKDNSSLDGMTESDIPTAARGSYLDPFTWYTTDDFNVTYTNQTVGDLPIMGLYTDWDDSTQANDKVAALNDDWGDYSSTPARGVNLGGWLSLEPFITPSLFNYDSKLGIIDEYTLCTFLGAKKAAATLEKHYATFVTESTFSDIAAAGLDHVRIPYSYWAVQTYDNDPYVFRTSWRYLLRGIEWARKYGLRVNLDLHALPGSQNGWNHSGRQGEVRWLNGTDGDTNAQRSLDVHDRLSKFFAQDRYRNIITFYGLANEPKMTSIDVSAVLDWTTKSFELVRANGMNANIVFGDGFMGLANWQGKLTGMDGLVLDVHQYVIFNNDQIIYTHQKKVEYACDGWTQQTDQSMDTSTGFGPTMFAEWSQADSDCAKHLTNVGWGNRWEGTYDSGNATLDALTPKCPAQDSTCSCDEANGDVGSYSDTYKKFLKMFAEAQMVSFEKGWGWWYWTWDTESAPLWSYKQGLAAGILPTKAYEKEFECDSDVPDFEASGLSETF